MASQALEGASLEQKSLRQASRGLCGADGGAVDPPMRAFLTRIGGY